MSTAARRAQFERDRARHVRALLDRLPSETEKVTWDLPRLWALRDERLRRLLAHAKRHSRWYRDRLADVEVEGFSAEDVSELPVMTKVDLMAHWDDIVTDARLTLPRVEEHLRAVTENGMAYLFGEFVAVASSGSSGRRAVVVRDFDGLLEGTLANVRNVEWWRARRSAEGGGDRQARLFSETPIHISGVIGHVFEREARTTVTIPPSMPTDAAVEALIAFQPTRIIGYPSVLHRVAVALDERGRSLAPWDVAVNGEGLLPEAREAIEGAFGVPVRNIYGTTETGTIAESHPPHRQLQLIEDVVVLEARGDTTLVTNVVNLVLPIIRYELDDQITILDTPPPGPATGRVLADVVGRSSEAFRYPSGVTVDASVFRSILASVAAVTEYQVRQEQAGAAVDVVAAGPVDAPQLAGRLRAALVGTGLDNPRVRVVQVDSIARKGPVEKLRRFIPFLST